VSDSDSAKDDIPARHSRLAMAARYAAVVFGATVGSAVLRLGLHRVLAIPQDESLRGPIIAAFILGIFWLALSFLVLLRSRSSGDGSLQSRNPPQNKRRTVLRTIIGALVVACALAITAWTGLSLNDEIFESRDLPWIAPLITVQEYGFVKASQMSPCRLEGCDTGREAYKWIPIFLMADSLSYFPFVLIGLFSFQHSEAVRKTVQACARLFSRWCIVVVGTGLVALQALAGLNLDTHDSLYPHPGIGHWHFGLWEQVNDITGLLIKIAGLSLPFYLYRAIRRAGTLAEVRTRLAEATSLAATMLVALMLGDVY
jgi:hypothetical protein